MPRPSKIWKRKRDGWYYATINGEKEKLSPDRQEALDLFHRLKGEEEKQRGRRKPTQAKVSCTLEEVCNAFLDDSQATKEERTYENLKGYLQSFCDAVGKHRRVRDITGEEFTKWSRGAYPGASTQTAARSAVMACFNWGVRNGRLFDSPLWGLKKGTYERRERILTPAEREKIHGVLKGRLKDFLFAIEQTGARPFSEIGRLTAAMIDSGDGSVTLEKHKTKKKCKKRTIYFPPDLFQRIKELAEEFPEGPLFRTQKGNAWTRQAACKAMRRLERRAGVDRLNVYCWRHSYITDCLAKGMSPSIIARLVGNSARTIMRYYDHLEQKKDELREAARRAVS